LTLALKIDQRIDQYLRFAAALADEQKRSGDNPGGPLRMPEGHSDPLPNHGEFGRFVELHRVELAKRLEATARRYVTTLIKAKYQRLVYEDDLFISRFPWEAALPPGDPAPVCWKQPSLDGVLGVFGAYELAVHNNKWWPADVSASDSAKLLDRDDDEFSRKAANDLREGKGLWGGGTFGMGQLWGNEPAWRGKWCLEALAWLADAERRILDEDTTALAAAQRVLARLDEVTSPSERGRLEREKLVNAVLQDATVDDREWLTRVVRDHLLGLRNVFLEVMPETEAEATKTVRGVFRHDKRIAQHLKDLAPGKGGDGNEAAELIRNASKERSQQFAKGELQGRDLWIKWTSESLVSFVDFLWQAVIQPNIEHQKENPAALARAVATPALAVFTGAVQIVNQNEAQTSLELEENRVFVPAIGEEALQGMVGRGLKEMQSVLGQRIFNFLVEETWERDAMKVPDPHIFQFASGSYKEFVERVHARTGGMPHKKESTQAKKILLAMHHAQFHMFGELGSLISVYQRANAKKGSAAPHLDPENRTLSSIEVLKRLRPGYVRQMAKQSLRNRELIQLVPVLPLPPLVGSRRGHSNQCTLSRALLLHFRSHAKDIAENRGALVTEKNWRDLAERSGFSRRSDQWKEARDRWLHDGDDGAALIKSLGPDRYTLGDEYAAQREFIASAGRREKVGGWAGRKGARQRRKRRGF